VSDTVAKLIDALEHLPAKPPKDVMSVSECAEYLTLSETKLRTMIAKYQIPFTPLGGRIVFYKPVVDEWLRGQTIYRPDQHRKMLDGRRVA
jgi:excisionase family DNA binding protein